MVEGVEGFEPELPTNALASAVFFECCQVIVNRNRAVEHVPAGITESALAGCVDSGLTEYRGIESLVARLGEPL